LVLVSYFSELKWISFDFLEQLEFLFKKIQNHIQNHPMGQICLVLIVGWPWQGCKPFSSSTGSQLQSASDKDGVVDG